MILTLVLLAVFGTVCALAIQAERIQCRAREYEYEHPEATGDWRWPLDPSLGVERIYRRMDGRNGRNT